MGRIAEAYARAGRKLQVEDDGWTSDHEAAGRHLGHEVSTPEAQRPNPKSQSPEPKAQSPISAQAIDFELASAVRKVFLAPKDAVRSVLFCAAPGEAMTDVAWQAAEALAAQSGKTVAFVEDPASLAPHQSPGHALITRIDWCPVDDSVPSSSVLGVGGPRKTNDVLGEQIADLLPRFNYVIVNVTVSMTELRPLARQVDGVIVVVAEGRTRTDAAKRFVTDLRADARLLGAILIA